MMWYCLVQMFQYKLNLIVFISFHFQIETYLLYCAAKKFQESFSGKDMPVSEPFQD